MTRIFSKAVRGWIYGVAIAAVPVLVYFDALPAEAAPVILPLILAVLNLNDAPAVEAPVDEGTGDFA